VIYFTALLSLSIYCYNLPVFIDSFTTTWLGKTIDVDGVAGVQCVDLIKKYILDGFGIPVQPMGDAIAWWQSPKTVLLSKFDKIASQTPQKGDIVILHGLAGNKFGHIVLCIDNLSPTTFLALEQNGVDSSAVVKNGDEVRTRQIPNSRIAGLLRPKSSINAPVLEYYTIRARDTFWALERAWGMPAGQLQKLNPTLDPRRLQIGQRIRKK
jgi:LysM repeat protein